MSKINLRRHYDLYLSNTLDNSYGAGFKLVKPKTPSFRGTPRQIVKEAAEYQRISGGCDTMIFAVDPKTGERVSVDAMWWAIRFAELRAANRGRR